MYLVAPTTPTQKATTTMPHPISLMAEPQVTDPRLADINAQLHGLSRGELECDHGSCRLHAEVVVLSLHDGQDNVIISESRTMCRDHADFTANRSVAGTTIIIDL